MEFIERPNDLYTGEVPVDEAFIGTDLYFRRWGDMIELKFKPGTPSVTFKIDGQSVTENIPEDGIFNYQVSHKPTDFGDAFKDNTDLIDIIALPDLSLCSVMRSMFANCTSLTEVTLRDLNFATEPSIAGLFDGCTGLTYLDLSVANPVTCNVGFLAPNIETLKIDNWTLGSLTQPGWINLMFFNCRKIKNIEGNITLNDTLNLSLCFELTKESVMNLIKGMNPQAEGKSISLYSDVKSQLTEEEIKMATDKGWTIL